MIYLLLLFLRLSTDQSATPELPKVTLPVTFCELSPVFVYSTEVFTVTLTVSTASPVSIYLAETVA